MKTVRAANKLPFNVGWNIIIATAVTYIILAFATADGDNTTTCEISFLFQKNDILMANSLAQVFPKIFPAASTSPLCLLDNFSILEEVRRSKYVLINFFF